MAGVNASGVAISRGRGGKGLRTKSARNRQLRRAAKNAAPRRRTIVEDER